MNQNLLAVMLLHIISIFEELPALVPTPPATHPYVFSITFHHPSWRRLIRLYYPLYAIRHSLSWVPLCLCRWFHPLGWTSFLVLQRLRLALPCLWIEAVRKIEDAGMVGNTRAVLPPLLAETSSLDRIHKGP